MISLETVNLLDYFSIIPGRDNVKNPKPHPDHLHYICEKIEVKPTEIIVIGDNRRDIEGAINVGARSIAVFNNISRLSGIEMMKRADKSIHEGESALKIIQVLKDLF